MKFDTYEDWHDALVSDTMTTAREELLRGEKSPTEIYEEVGSTLGFDAQAREMVGHMLLDPLNLVGEGLATAGFKVTKLASAGKFVKAAALTGTDIVGDFTKLRQAGNTLEYMAQAFEKSGDVMYFGKKFRAIVRGLPADEALEVGSFGRFMAGITKEGVFKEAAKPYTGGNLWLKFKEFTTGLTPTARVSYFCDQFDNMLGALIDRAGGDLKGIRSLLRSIGLPPEAAAKALDNTVFIIRDANGKAVANIPKYMNSLDGNMLGTALKDVLPKADDLVDNFYLVDKQRETIRLLANMTNEDPFAMIKRLSELSNEDAIKWWNEFVSDIQKRAAAGEDLGKAQLKQLDEISRMSRPNTLKGIIGLSGKDAQDYAKIFFGKDRIPFSNAEAIVDLKVLLGEGLGKWTETWFDIKPTKWMNRMSNTLKKMQSYALLGVNPNYLLNNSINNIVTMLWDGMFGMSRHSSRVKYLEDFGIIPSRLKQGFNITELAGELGGSMAGEHTVFAKAFEDIIKKAMKGNDFFAVLGTTGNKALSTVDKMMVMSHYSGKVESWSSEVAVVTALKDYMTKNWNEANYTRMSKETEDVLEAAQPGLSKKVKNAVARGKNFNQIQKDVFKDLYRKSILDYATTEEREILSGMDGLTDDIDAMLEERTLTRRCC